VTTRSAPPTTHGIGLLVAAWSLAILPLLYFAVQVPRFGALQYNDYYGILQELADGDGLSTDPFRWLAVRSNEHTVTLPALVYAANIAATHGDNRGLSAFSLLVLAATLLLLSRLLPGAIRRGAALVVALPLLALLVFTPAAAHSIVMGFSGTIWFTANLAAVAAIAALTRLEREAPVTALWPVLAAGLVAALSNSTSLALWPALVAGALVRRLPRRHLAVLGAATVVAYAAFLARFHALPWHPKPNADHPLSLASYVAAYLGSLLTSRAGAAVVIGALALAASVALVAMTRRELASRAPWLMLQLYGLGAGLGTAVGRSGWGDAQALASRYASLAALFWIGLLGSLLVTALSASPPARRRAGVLACAGLAAIAGVGAFVRGLPVLASLVERASGHRVASLALVHGITDPEAFRSFHPFVGDRGDVTGEWAYAYLQRRRHVPFQRRWWTELGAPPPPGTVLAGEPFAGESALGAVRPLGGRRARVSGRIEPASGRLGHVLLLDPDGIVRGEGVAVPRGGGAWQGYVDDVPPGAALAVFVRLAGGEAYHRLPSALALP
jgi:hypothetical protein